MVTNIVQLVVVVEVVDQQHMDTYGDLKMTNAEIIEKYGEEKGRKIIEQCQAASKKWHREHSEYAKKYIEEHRQQWNAYARKYQSKHRQEQRDRVNAYHNSISGRVTNLYTSYRQYDIRYLEEEPQLTRAQLLAKLEGAKCVYCGCDDIIVLGLDRVNNSKPHSVWNTVCSCRKCNVSRNRKSFEDYLAYRGITLEEFIEKNDAVFSDELRIQYE